MIKPKRLKKGDTIAVLSPSWGGPSIFPHIYDQGIKTLLNLGLKVKEYPSTRKENDFIYRHPDFRAKDINDAFADSDVKGIITTIGGEDSIRILPFIDIEIIKNNPKLFMGYSDTTSINTFLNQLGLVTFNGPAIMSGFSQYEALGEQFQQLLKSILFDNPDNFEYKAYKSYCEGYLDWANVENTGKTKEMKENSGWNWLQGNSVVTGQLFGGCIEVLDLLNGTKFWPNVDFWRGKILFLETSEDKPGVTMVRCILRNLAIQGILSNIKALLIGRARDYTDAEKKELDESVLKVVKTELNNSKLPIVTNMDFGHTDPQWVLPLGIKAEVDCQQKKFSLKEKIFGD